MTPESEWLAANRESYRGQWVALDGGTLLASGANARQVFAEVAGHQPLPLVVFVPPAETEMLRGKEKRNDLRIREGRVLPGD